MSHAADGGIPERSVGDLPGAAIARLRQLPQHATGFQARLDALQDLSETILMPGRLPLLFGDGLAFLSAFLRRENLAKLVERELKWPDALERFVHIGGRKSLRILPRGLACHWVAGNVPLLGVLSWSLSALLGNNNLVRASTRQDDYLTPLLNLLRDASDAGAGMAASTIVLSFDRDDRAAHEEMSGAADVRIAWGGDEAVNAIRDLPKSWECEDIIFGPRNSIAVVDPRVMTKRMIQRLALDAVLFDQLACSSPQRLFVRGDPAESEFDLFLEEFIAQFEKQAIAHPRHPLDFGETYQITLDRSRTLMRGWTVWRDPETQWTISLVDSPQYDVVCANRYIEVVAFRDFENIYQHVPDNVQTVTQALDSADLDHFSEDVARQGVCRLPRPGEANHFENPWDGIAMVARLTRWVLRTDAK